jgi:oligogalacturonide transport system substrate-binding protein
VQKGIQKLKLNASVSSKEECMRKNSKLMAAGLSVVLAAGLCACGSSSSSAAATSATASQSASSAADAVTSAESATTSSGTDDHEAVTLRFMWWGGDERADATIKVINQFEEKYPWITIEPEYGSSDGYQEKLTTQLSSGTAADIVQMGPGWLPSYISSNPDYFIDFNDYSDKIDLSTFDSDFLAQNGEINGKQYGLPTGVAGQAFIYNKTLADKCGIEMPASKEDMTWDKLMDMGTELHSSNSDKYLFTIGDTLIVQNMMRPYLTQLTGKPMIDDATGKMTFTSEQMTQFLQYVKDMYDNGVIPPMADIAAYSSGDSLQTDPKWISGDTYVGIYCASSTAEVAATACTDGEFVATFLPEFSNAADDGYYANCPQYMCIPSSSEHIDEDLLFLDYFYNNEDAAATLGLVRSVPPTSVGQKVCTDNGSLEGLAKDTVTILQDNYHGINGMGLTTDGEVEQICKDMVDQIAYNQSTPEEVAKSGMDLIQNFLDSKN